MSLWTLMFIVSVNGELMHGLTLYDTRRQCEIAALFYQNPLTTVYLLKCVKSYSV